MYSSVAKAACGRREVYKQSLSQNAAALRAFSNSTRGLLADWWRSQAFAARAFAGRRWAQSAWLKFFEKEPGRGAHTEQDPDAI